MPECIRHTALPHTTRLFADFLYHFDRVAGFYADPPGSPESFERAAAAIRLDPAHRAALAAALAETNRGAGPAAGNNLDRLAEPGTVAVTTGQQVGLYTGPIFTIYKALSTAKLAQELTARGIPAVPVFWLATEDHDLDEVNHVWVFDAANQPVRLQAQASRSNHEPVGGLRFTDNASEALQRVLATLPFGELVSRQASEAYQHGATFGSGFRNLLERLLEPYGVLLIDPLAPAIRRLAAPLMARVVERAPELCKAVLARGRELEAAGYHVQVHVDEKTSFFFVLENGLRTHLDREGDAYRAGNGRAGEYTKADLLQWLAREPEAFSPNALLRPVVQDYLLPTAAYVGGPAELAYLAQAEALYRRLLGRMPVVLPRATFTLLDSRAQKLLGRYGLSVLDVMHGTANLEQHIADRLIPPPLQKAFEAGQNKMQEALSIVERELKGYDETLGAALDKSRRKIEYPFSKIQAKAAREGLRRTERARADASYLLHLIYPEKTLQERLYSVLPFLARHGPDLTGRLHDAIRLDCLDHQVLVV
jgi:bacillithiol biosynthesis cysteine-adding enzyme BshC